MTQESEEGWLVHAKRLAHGKVKGQKNLKKTETKTQKQFILVCSVDHHLFSVLLSFLHLQSILQLLLVSGFALHRLHGTALFAKSGETFQCYPAWSFSSTEHFFPKALPFQWCSGQHTLQILHLPIPFAGSSLIKFLNEGVLQDKFSHLFTLDTPFLGNLIAS